MNEDFYCNFYYYWDQQNRTYNYRLNKLFLDTNLFLDIKKFALNSKKNNFVYLKMPFGVSYDLLTYYLGYRLRPWSLSLNACIGISAPSH